MVNASDLMREMQEMRDGGYLPDPILRKAVTTIADSDERCEWTGIYLMNDSNDGLWLHNYIGEPTEHAKIGIGEGVCGTAVAERENQNIGDVTELDNYLACSPDTRSELVVLIRAGDEILGQIDIDSDEEDAFSDDDEGEVQAVADKLAEVIMAQRRS